MAGSPPMSSSAVMFLCIGLVSYFAITSILENKIKAGVESNLRQIQLELETAVTKENFQSVPDNLQTWNSLLSKTLEDIEANLKSNKKSRALISFEIQLRKSITRTESLKIRAPADQQDIFDSCLDQAEKIRKRFVDILFHR